MVKIIDFDIFAEYPELTAAFSTKEGGVSEGIYRSMNLSLGSADSPDCVRENYRRFAEAIGTCPENFVISKQTHTTNIRITGVSDRGKGTVRERDYDDVDGLMTNEKNVVLCLLFADCVPVYLYDPVRHAISLVHSGWKGTAGKISGKAVSMMHERYGTEPQDLKIAIGPSICRDCYEVSRDLYDAFSVNYTESQLNLIFLPGKSEEKYQLDLWKAISLTLTDAGVKEENIYNPHICTYENHELLFSHRYTNGKRGNLAAAMYLK